ncbi:acyltransferase [Pseudoalteromonas sp. MTN2-4]|uniref:acyltransferase n=1 Tax=Pseudoalteromonas sp. MTN2-4 TaxID=3056555 RepID=UPI0036F3E071
MQLIRGAVATAVLVLNTALWGTLIFLLGLVKLLVPFALVSHALHGFYKCWCRGNYFALKLSGVQFSTDIAPQVNAQGWYLLVANHISWLDIIVLTAIDALPAPKFFLKDELKYVPLIGSGAWALGMPFMKRASKAQIAKNPKLKGMDVARTQKSCKNFKHHPTTVINFAEGTRFTEHKQQKQNSPFKHLLKPKAGGTAFALQVLVEQLDGLINATLIYHGGNKKIFQSFMLGKLAGIDVKLDYVPLAQVPQGDYQLDKTYRVTFQQYLNTQWYSKDSLIDSLATQQSSSSAIAKEVSQL